MFQYPDTHGVDGDMLDAGPLGEVAAAVEAAGWDGLALTEHPAPGVNWLVATVASIPFMVRRTAAPPDWLAAGA